MKILNRILAITEINGTVSIGTVIHSPFGGYPIPLIAINGKEDLLEAKKYFEYTLDVIYDSKVWRNCKQSAQPTVAPYY